MPIGTAGTIDASNVLLPSRGTDAPAPNTRRMVLYDTSVLGDAASVLSANEVDAVTSSSMKL